MEPNLDSPPTQRGTQLQEQHSLDTKDQTTAAQHQADKEPDQRNCIDLLPACQEHPSENPQLSSANSAHPDSHEEKKLPEEEHPQLSQAGQL